MTQTQQHKKNISIDIVPFIIDESNPYYFLHEQTRLKTGFNLRSKTPTDIHALIAKNELLGALNEAGKPVGMLSIRHIPHEEQRALLGLMNSLPKFTPQIAKHTVEFNSFAVDLDYTKQGIGAQLVTHGIQIACQRRHKYAIAKVWTENAGAQRIFEQAGFIVRASTQRPNDAIPLLVLGRDLA